MKYRPISFLKSLGDLEWLKTKTCPRCELQGRLRFGMHPREVLRCDNCGNKFRIKGRPVK